MHQKITWVIASKNCLYVQHLENYFISKKLIQYKVKAPIAGQYPIAGQSHAFFSKLEIYESLIAVLVYRIQFSKCTL